MQILHFLYCEGTVFQACVDFKQLVKLSSLGQMSKTLSQILDATATFSFLTSRAITP